MNSRERVIRAIEFESPDRIPIMHAFLPSAIRRHGEKIIREIFEKYPHDYADVYQYSTMPSDPLYQKGVHCDEWGCIWLNVQGGILGQVVGHPLESWDSLKNYEFPNPLNDQFFEQVEDSLKKEGHKKYYTVDYICFFERLQWLRGFKNLMIDLIKLPKELSRLAEKIVNYNIERIKRWGEIGVDEVFLGDDLGHQRGLIIDPELFRKFFKPFYQRMINTARKKGMFVQFHSDGYIIDLLPELIGMGIDVLNVQMTIMGIEKLGALFGGKVCFRSDVDCQHILPFGTPNDVVKHVKQIIKAFGNFDGGLIGCGEIGANVPLSNIIAMYETFKNYGRYPLKWVLE